MLDKTVVIYVGVIHQVDDEKDFADVSFLSISKEIAESEFLKSKEFAIKTLKLRCVVDNHHLEFYTLLTF